MRVVDVEYERGTARGDRRWVADAIDVGAPCRRILIDAQKELGHYLRWDIFDLLVSRCDRTTQLSDELVEEAHLTMQMTMLGIEYRDVERKRRKVDHHKGRGGAESSYSDVVLPRPDVSSYLRDRCGGLLSCIEHRNARRAHPVRLLGVLAWRRSETFCCLTPRDCGSHIRLGAPERCCH